MLNDICDYLKNYFDRNQPKRFASFKIVNGQIEGIEDMVKNNQYFRIVGSIFNDGIYKYPATDLTDEEFSGAVWAMAIPKRLEKLAKEIADWQDKYGGVDSAAMSPYNSESFGGYSYSKSGGGSSTSDDAGGTWQAAYASQLAKWRKI